MFSIKKIRYPEFRFGSFAIDCGVYICVGKYQLSFVWHRHITPYDRARCDKAAIKGQGAIEFLVVLGLLVLLAIIILAILPVSVWQNAIKLLVSALTGV